MYFYSSVISTIYSIDHFQSNKKEKHLDMHLSRALLSAKRTTPASASLDNGILGPLESPASTGGPLEISAEPQCNNAASYYGEVPFFDA